jgi:hypothetical protein
MQVTSAASPTVVSGHTAPNSSSFVITSPGRSAMKDSKASAFGVSLTSRAPDISPPRGSRR